MGLKKIREDLKNPKTKSLVLLGIYAVFFIIVFILLSGTNKGGAPINSSNNSHDLRSYQYSIVLLTDKKNIIEGTYYYNKSLFKYNNATYYYENNKLYLINNDSYYLTSIDYNITKLFNNEWFNDLKEESTTTYNDNTREVNYTLDADKFYNYFFELESNYKTMIGVKIKYDTSNITNINIDLTNLNIDLKKIEIEYSNINNIKSLEFNKENYIYRG